MLISVKRFHFAEHFTIGKILFDGEDSGLFTLEDKVRQIPGMSVVYWKVPGESAIPVGKYKLATRYSPHFKCELPHLLNVDGFEYVLIHWGNKPDDTEGCILVGSTWDGHSGFIGASKVAFEKVLAAIKEAKDEVWLEVS
jgi:hypothetical protein